jgi:uncharacterized protein with HEPN domain
MLEAATDAMAFCAGRTRADLDHDRMLRRALIQCLEVVGEASVRISAETREQLAEIPWREVRGMRNLLTHAYFELNLDILWKTVVQDVPALAAALQSALGTPDESGR